MRILILGGSGMLGHELLMSWQATHSVIVTLRKNPGDYGQEKLFNESNSVIVNDVCNMEGLEKIVADITPDAIINCIGVIKQRHDSLESIPSIQINALFPHLLGKLCKAYNVRLVHISTDCVFSGKKGNYCEEDSPDPVDLYGRTKLLGELYENHCVTLRTSIIGLELKYKQSLVEWFLSQKGQIAGYKNAIYSGVITRELARIIEKILIDYKDLKGLYHIASDAISKYELLSMLKSKLDRRDVSIIGDESYKCDRSLNGAIFVNSTQYEIPSWDAMLDELAVQIKERNK